MPRLERQLRKVDRILREVLDKTNVNLSPDGPHSRQSQKTALTQALHRFDEKSGSSAMYLPVAKYIAIMSVIWPKWQRISMLPHLGPKSGHAEPGGMVICEDSPVDRQLGQGELESVTNISSVAMWPWLAVEEAEDRDAVGPWAETPWNILSSVTNDFEKQESFLKRYGISLIDTASHSGRTTRHIAAHKSIKGSLLDGEALNATVIIPVNGRKKFLLACFSSIFRQSFFERQPKNVEVIIVHNGNEPNVAEEPICEELLTMGRAFQKKGGVFRILETRESIGRASARNLGIDAAQGEVIFFVDSTMVLEKDFITEHIMRHQSVEGLALLGFKETLPSWNAYEKLCNKIRLGKRRPDFRKDWKYTHKLGPLEKEIHVDNHKYKIGDTVNYMKLTNWLRGHPALEEWGVRSIPTFFQTNIVSVKAAQVKSVGGFETAFDPLWGFEDSFMGAVLMAKGVKLVPCPSSVAFKIEHAGTEGKKDHIYVNQIVMRDRLKNTMMAAYTEKSLRTKCDKTRERGVKELSLRL